MQNRTTITFRLDETTKRQIELLAIASGLTVTALITATMKQVVKEQKIVIKPRVENPKMYERYMRRAEAQYQAALERSKEMAQAEAEGRLAEYYDVDLDT